MHKQYVIWTEGRHFIGVAAIDGEHCEIARRVNQIIGEASNGTPCNKLKELLNDMIEYVGEHFAHEERLMLVYDYPGRQSHADEHDRLIRQLKNIVKGDAKATLTPAFLIDWMELHALQDDMELGKYLITKGCS